ncbi:type II toxin-antitoxin system PemK/MazF family toxin [Silvanigrella aquatica]|uniref:Type II toxin-antitoxin system PemK/MazF family toxin n=1 Tax=Silvanigrella aquatica TaxID=1915309 RepID=A0A1L4CY66_9BACT|nr:type II toxin-antitoxin system PemK/MazF family toxin [Silvanigrella aquatica]APJ02901.1 hypothetical protein AXG55_02770 [Silvanigrella aquatica]
MKQWEIWKMNLDMDMESQTEIQMSEENFDFNYCIIITGQSFLDAFHAPTILPISTNFRESYSVVSIEESKSVGLFCESFIICDQILTVQKDVFIKKIGIVPEHLRSKIQNKIFNYLNE